MSRPQAVIDEPRLPERVHLDGCPAERIESYEAISTHGEKVVVTRCVDCGGQIDSKQRR